MRAAIPLLAALALVACGDEPADKPATATSPQITAPAGPATPWPADAPPFAPAYPAAIVTAASAGNGSGGSAIVTFHTPDSPATVVAFYQAQAAKARLARISALATKQSTLFSAGDPATGRALTIQAAGRGDHTAAALTYAAGRPAA